MKDKNMNLPVGKLQELQALGGLSVHKQVTFDGTSANGAVATAAALSTALTGANNDMDFTAVATDATGNDVTIAYVDPGAISQALSVTVLGNAITVHLATNGAGAITSTAAQIKTAYDLVAAAVALATCANKAANDGTGVVTAMAATALSGGKTGYKALFTVTGQCLVALVAVCKTSLAGATATLRGGKSGSTNRYHAQVTATNIVAGDTIDLSGEVAAGTAVGRTPNQVAFDAESIIATAGTAAITAGVIDYYLFYIPLSDDGLVTAA